MSVTQDLAQMQAEFACLSFCEKWVAYIDPHRQTEFLDDAERYGRSLLEALTNAINDKINQDFSD